MFFDQPDMTSRRRHLPAFAAFLSLAVAFAGAKDTPVPIGAQAGKFSFKDIRFLPRSLDDFGKPKAFVIAFITTECPLAQRYLPKLKELSAHFKDQGAQFIAVNVGPDDSLKDVACFCDLRPPRDARSLRFSEVNEYGLK